MLQFSVADSSRNGTCGAWRDTLGEYATSIRSPHPPPKKFLGVGMTTRFGTRTDGVGRFDELASELPFQDLDIRTEDRIGLQVIVDRREVDPNDFGGLGEVPFRALEDFEEGGFSGLIEAVFSNIGQWGKRGGLRRQSQQRGQESLQQTIRRGR